MTTDNARRHQRTVFTSVDCEGELLPPDFLRRIVDKDAHLEGLSAEAYHHDGEKLNEVINRSWIHLLNLWHNFKRVQSELLGDGPATSLMRERWLLPLFAELDYGRLQPVRPVEVHGKRYPISHLWNTLPLHLTGFGSDIDDRSRSKGTAFRGSSHDLVQELLNRSDTYLWGMVSNGLHLRVLRRNMRLTHQVYIEFDLETMMEGEVYTDFVLLWLLCHQSRFEGERLEECWLEKWSRIAHEQDLRALAQLRDGVEAAISSLGKGFLACRVNRDLDKKLSSGKLSTQEYYRQVLRLVYRLLVLFVAEDRDILFHPDAEPEARQRYHDYYSTTSLRHLAGLRIGTRHTDLFYSLRLVMNKLALPGGCLELGLPALNGFLFSNESIPDLENCEIANHDLLDAVRSLAFISERGSSRAVDYKNIGPEELGSIYESLLELHPTLNIDGPSFALARAKGNERKASGTYYTPTSLVNCLLDSALEPVLQEAYSQPDPEKALLNLKICDPACGSGHFLIAAAHRLANRLALVRSAYQQPGLAQYREALRDVVRCCIYGVDINPMTVELCKVNLWLESIVPGKPLLYLDYNIQCGNSLVGTTPALLDAGIPDGAFEPIEGDNPRLCTIYKRRNKEEQAGQLHIPFDKLDKIVISAEQLKNINDGTFEGVHRIKALREDILASPEYQYLSLLADVWCASFVWKKVHLPPGSIASPITEGILREIKDGGSLTSDRYNEVVRLRRQYQFFHWYLAFYDIFRIPHDEEPENEQIGWSGGFDVVLSNPPWEHIKLKEQEWFAVPRPDIAEAPNTAHRRRMIGVLASEDTGLFAKFSEACRIAEGKSHFIRHSGHYPLCGRGDVDMYSIFAETARHIIKPAGRIGCIVPSGIATGDTTKYFFQDIMNTSALVSLYDFDNVANIFPETDSRNKFCLLTLTGSTQLLKSGSEFAFFLHTIDDLQDKDRRFSLTSSDIERINPASRTCPIFRSRRDADLTKTIYASVPPFIDEDVYEVNPWGVTFKRIFDMANDSHRFRIRQELETDKWKLKGNTFFKNGQTYLPLYEGKMIWHFDHRFNSYHQSQTEEIYALSDSQHDFPGLLALPRYWVHEAQMPDVFHEGRKAFLAFRDITNTTNVRTAIFCIIPPVPCGHSLPAIMLDAKRSSDMVYIATCTSSFVFDYVARQKLGGTHMTLFILKQLPVLPPDPYGVPCQWDTQITLGNWILPRALELIYTAWDLAPFAADCGYTGPPFRWNEERRFQLRCELDAAYFHLYGIERDDVDYIIETFSIVKRKDVNQYREYRTKHTILEIYDAMMWAMETGKTYKTLLEPPPAHPSTAHIVQGNSIGQTA